MWTSKANVVAEKFKNLDLHDDGLKSVKVYTPSKKSDSARVEMEFEDDSTGASKVLWFRGCGNVRYVMDFDVLADNWFAQTDRVASIREVARLQKFVRAQIAHWHVKYMPPGPKHRPIKKKLSSIRRYALFRVTFFGGTVEVLAKRFSLKRLKKARSSELRA